MDYLVVIERGSDGSFSAYIPDLPGCVSCGDSLDEVKVLIQEALQLHIEAMREHGQSIPSPTTQAMVVHADAA